MTARATLVNSRGTGWHLEIVHVEGGRSWTHPVDVNTFREKIDALDDGRDPEEHDVVRIPCIVNLWWWTPDLSTMRCDPNVTYRERRLERCT